MKYPLLLIIAVALLGLSACKKVKVSAASFSNEDAANVIGSSLASGSSGVTTIQSDVALNSQTVYTNTTTTGCGVTKLDSISHKSAAGSASTYSYKAKFTSLLNCNAKNLPDNVTNTLTYVGSYSGPKVAYINSGNTSFTVAGLTPTATVYSLNGTYHSTGNFKLTADSTKNGTVTLDFTLKNVLINKTTAPTPAGITSGTATVYISGYNGKGSFSFDGTLTFSGSSLAVLTLNGTVYFVNLLTGNIVKQ